LEKTLQNGILIDFKLDFVVVEVEVVPNDLKEKMIFQSDNFIDDLKTIFGETIDDDIVSIIKGCSLEKAVEGEDKFGPPPAREISFFDDGQFL